MIRGILAFLVVTMLVSIGIQTVRRLNGKELWSATKTLGYAAACSAISIMILVTIVVIF